MSLNYSCVDGVGISHNSVTTEYWDSSSGETRIAALATAVITLCFFFIGLPSNFLILVSILWQQLYRQPTYILLMNLALADLLLCVLIMPFTIVSGFAGEFIFGTTDNARCRVCQLGLFLTVLALLTLHNLTLLSVDRFIFIKYPLKYHKIVTVRRVTVIVISVWISSIIISTFPLFGFGDFGYSPSISLCLVKFMGETELTKNIYYPVFLAIVTMMSLSVLLASNIWVGCIVQKHIREIYTMKNNISRSDVEFIKEIKDKLARTKHRKQLQFVKVFGAILSTNLITFIPLVLRVFHSAATQRKVPVWLMIVVYTSIISVAVVHPIIQAKLVPGLRKHFASFEAMLRCGQGRSAEKVNVDTSQGNAEHLKCLKFNCCLIFSLTFLPDVRDMNVHGEHVSI